MKKILLFTGYEPFFNSDDNFIFTNKTFFKQFENNKNLSNYKFLPPLKQDSNSRYIDEMKTNELIKTVENDIFKSLNNLHSTNFSNRYWKIILGHWLDRFVRLVFFRYKVLEHCININESVDFTYLSKENHYSQAIDQTFDIWLASIDSEWNFNLFSKIYSLAFADNLNVKFVKTKNNQFKTDIQNKISTKKEFIKGKIQKIISSLNFLSRRNNIACKTTYLNFYNEIKLNLLNKDFPSILQNQSYHTKKINLELRNKINIKNDTNDKFEKILRNLIPNSLPKTIVENYSILFDKTHKCNWPSKPKVIFTSNSYDGDDFFKIWTAYQVEKNNSKYVIGQHGVFDVSEKLLKNSIDYQVCDYYLRWGEKKYDKDIELFNLKLVNKKFNLKNKNKILIIARSTGHEVETYSRLDEFNIYHKCLIELLSSFSKQTQDKIIVRLNRAFRWTNANELKHLKKSFNFLKIDTGEKNIFSLYEKSKIAIFMYYSTGCLETISLDIPTAIYCPAELVYQDPAEEQYFKMLNKCKILSYNIEEFIENINYILTDVQKWWCSDDLSDVKKKFIKRYSRIEKENSVKKISKILKNLE